MTLEYITIIIVSKEAATKGISVGDVLAGCWCSLRPINTPQVFQEQNQCNIKKLSVTHCTYAVQHMYHL